MRTWREGSFTGDPERYVKDIYQERDLKLPFKRVICLYRGPVGEPGGDWLAGTFGEKRIVYLGFFLGPRGY
jgi:hypothetical protein